MEFPFELFSWYNLQAEEPFSLEAQSAADKENTQPSEDGSDLSGASSIHQNFIKPKGLYEPSAGSDDEDNPSIKVDANQQEMKEVLARNNSTEVVSAARLDERLKSPSATSLDSSKSDNYKSAASFTSIDGVKQASSFSSMPQPTPDGMVRYRSVSGRPLSDIVSGIQWVYYSIILVRFFQKLKYWCRNPGINYTPKSLASWDMCGLKTNRTKEC